MTTHILPQAVAGLAGVVVTAELVKEVVRQYGAQQFDGRCEMAAVVYDVGGRSETLLVDVDGVSFPPPSSSPSPSIPAR